MNELLKKLIVDLKSENASVRAGAAEELCLLECEAKSVAPEIVPEIVAACADDDEEVREWVIGALESWGAPKVADLPKLTELLEHENMTVGYWAATLIGRLACDGSDAVKALINTIAKNPHLPVRQRAVLALAKIGPAAKEALPLLKTTVASADTRLALLAQEAIKEINR